jgi:hypothetical protein
LRTFAAAALAASAACDAAAASACNSAERFCELCRQRTEKRQRNV